MANFFWVGGTGDWGGVLDDGSHWAHTSGGAGGLFGSPQPDTDNVTFDTNSSAGSYTVTIAQGTGCINLTVNPPASGVVSLANTSSDDLTMTGTISIGSTANLSGFVGTLFHAVGVTTKTFNPGGVTIGGPVRFTNTGTTQLTGNLVSSGTITLSSGTLDMNGNNVTCAVFSSSNASTRTITLGTGTLTLTSSGTVFDCTTTTGLTVTATTGTIKLTDATATNKTFAGGGLTYGNIWLTGAGTGQFLFTGANTFSDFKVDTPPHTIKFTAATTTTVTTFTVAGSAGNLMTFDSITGATWTIAKAGGGTISASYLSVTHSTASPAATWTALNSTNGGGNTNWTFAVSGNNKFFFFF